MVDRAQDAPWLAWLVEALHQAQWLLLRLLHACGLAGSAEGQPAWPWAWRLSGENLLLDAGQARLLAAGLGCAGAALLLLALACAWRRMRWPLAGCALLAVVLAPWPSASVVQVPAHPASFHTQPQPFSDTAIARGEAHYARHCLRCHGAQGNGQGRDAAAQPVWPPSFTSTLLWRRADGDLFHAIRHGVRGRDGRATMPGFAAWLSEAQTWDLLHYLRALAAGELLQATGSWAQPVPLPDMALRCHSAGKTRVSDWQGQRLLLTTAPLRDLLPDPRFITLWVPMEEAPSALPDAVDCVAAAPATATLALELVSASQSLHGVQLMADKAGWLRARNARGASAWRNDDLLCRTPDGTAQGVASGQEDALSRILRLMDAEPVRYVKGGRVHGTVF